MLELISGETSIIARLVCKRFKMTKLIFLLVFGVSLFAETPTVLAIRNARVVTVSGPEITRGTIVVRNGLIEAVGENVSIPQDAWIVDGEGLIVYPGLIDGLSTLGLPDMAPAAPAAAARGGRPAAPTTPAATPATPKKKAILKPGRKGREVHLVGGDSVDMAVEHEGGATAGAAKDGCHVGPALEDLGQVDFHAPGLEDRGYHVHEVDLAPFILSGGAAYCMTLRLDRVSTAEAVRAAE